MFKVRKMLSEDLTFAVRLTDTIDWKLAEEDFAFIIELEPEGCFVLLHNFDRIGIVTTISFGKVGWLGNLIVGELYRRQGAGSLLVSHAIQHLKSINVETIGLYAYMETTSFYKRLGFEYDSNFVVLKGRGFASSPCKNVKAATKADISQIVDYDCSCLGFSRKKLLEPVLSYANNLCFMYTESGKLLGFIIAKVYRGMAEIGPLICHEGDEGIALDLVSTALMRLMNYEATLCIHEKKTQVIAMLRKHGFVESFRVARMFLGPPIKNDSICLAESLERG